MDKTKIKNIKPDGSQKGNSKPSRAAARSKTVIAQAKEKTLQQYEKAKQFRAQVETAVNKHRTFFINSCPYDYSIRYAMKKRGWVEKINLTTMTALMYESTLSAPQPEGVGTDNVGSSASTSIDKPQFEKYAFNVSRKLYSLKVAPDFMWTVKRNQVSWSKLSKEQIVSTFPLAPFTTKIGLCQVMPHMHWYSGDCEVHFPRCYILDGEDEQKAFVDDYRLTACLSLLRWLVEKSNESGSVPVEDPSAFPEASHDDSTSSYTQPAASHLVVDFAVLYVGLYINACKHDDVDVPLEHNLDVATDKDWQTFLKWHHALINEHSKLQVQSLEKLQHMVHVANSMLDELKAHRPDLHVYGTHNVWIVKPAASCRGEGITMTSNFENIMSLASGRAGYDPQFVVQKYIERPLLIYDTKFDIRQWFLVTNWHPLTLWVYRESYLRFCSQTYSLLNLHKSLHLSNNAIQCLYKNGQRSEFLPEENMWDHHQFCDYLSKEGFPDVWEQTVFPKMCSGILGVLLASQENITHRKNSFELYGADFILTEDFKPWLLEINAEPCMSPTTSVTSRLCASCLDDVLKVVIDRRIDKSCSTGCFKLVYKQSLSSLETKSGVKLLVKGIGLSNPYLQKGVLSQSSCSAVEGQKTRSGRVGSSLSSTPIFPKPEPSSLLGSTQQCQNGPGSSHRASQSSVSQTTTRQATRKQGPPPRLPQSPRKASAIKPGKGNKTARKKRSSQE